MSCQFGSLPPPMTPVVNRTTVSSMAATPTATKPAMGTPNGPSRRRKACMPPVSVGKASSTSLGSTEAEAGSRSATVRAVGAGAAASSRSTSSCFLPETGKPRSRSRSLSWATLSTARSSSMRCGSHGASSRRWCRASLDGGCVRVRFRRRSIAVQGGARC